MSKSEEMQQAQRQIIIGSLLVVSAAFCFASMSLFIRLSGDLPVYQKSFFRNLVALVVAAGLLANSQQKFRFNKENLGLLVLRSFIGTLGILANYYAIDHLLLADASMLGKLAPFFTIIFSYVFLKEKVKVYQALAIILAFIGSLFIIKPGFSMVGVVAPLVGVSGAMAAGGAYTTVRFLSQRGERRSMIVFFFAAFSCLAMVPLMFYHYQPMKWSQLGYLLLAGVLATGGQLSITAAYSYAPAKDISVFDYSHVLFSALLGFAFFGQIPDAYSFIGYVIIIGVGVMTFVYKTKIKQSVESNQIKE